ncbi:MAG: hypothetical protein U0894_03225 [Pirellulales bacterium]
MATSTGVMIIRKTSPDRAVGQMVKELQRGVTITKKGDNVSTKLGHPHDAARQLKDQRLHSDDDPLLPGSGDWHRCFVHGTQPLR